MRHDDDGVGVGLSPGLPALALLLAGLLRNNLTDASDALPANRASWFAIDRACEDQAGAVHAEMRMLAWHHLGIHSGHEADDALVALLRLECLLKLFIHLCAVVLLHVLRASLGNTMFVGLAGLDD